MNFDRRYNPPERWRIYFLAPLIVGFQHEGVARYEAVDCVMLDNRHDGDRTPPTREQVYDFMLAIDWLRSDPIMLEQLEACDLAGAMARAHEDARERARSICEQEARGFYSNTAAAEAFAHLDRERSARDWLSVVEGGRNG